MNAKQLRAFEEDIKEEFLSGKIHAPIHLSGGNERQLIRIFKKVKRSDYVFSTHRSHLHALLHGISPEWLKAEIMAGRSMHINSRSHRFVTSSIVCGCVPIAVGVAMAIKRKRQKNHVWCFIGDMAASVGTFYECSKYAAKNDLPITFVVEDNGYSTNTLTRAAWGEAKGRPHIRRYKYEREYGHINVPGKWVIFK